MDEEADVGGEINIKTLFANSLLACSGSYGLSKSQPVYAAPAYGISIAAGLAGFLANATGNDTFNQIHHYTGGLSRIIVIPLIASEVCVANGIKLELAALNILYPAIHYIAKYILKKDDIANPKYLEASHALSICAIAYFSFLQENWWGVGLACIYAMSTFRQNIIDDPQASVALLGAGNIMYILKVK